MSAPRRQATTRILLTWISIGVVACEGERLPAWEEDDRPPATERAFRAAAWDTLFRLGGTLQDTLLQAPARLAADPRGVFVADAYAGRLLRVDRAGRLLWAWGRRGSGPDELERPRHLSVDARGRVWVLDLENARVVVLGADGQREASLSLAEVGSRPDAIVPRPDGGVLVLSDHPERSITVLDATSGVVDRRSFPWAGFRHLPPLASQMVAASEPEGERWVAAFSMADGFFPFEGSEWSRVRGWYVEPIPATKVTVEHRRSRDREQTTAWIEEPHFAAVDVSLDGDRILVLFHGKSTVASRVVDIYSHSTGEYLESLLLPSAVTALAYADSVYYGVVSDPYPAIVAWTPRPDTTTLTTHLPIRR